MAIYSGFSHWKWWFPSYVSLPEGKPTIRSHENREKTIGINAASTTPNAPRLAMELPKCPGDPEKGEAPGKWDTHEPQKVQENIWRHLQQISGGLPVSEISR